MWIRRGWFQNWSVTVDGKSFYQTKTFRETLNMSMLEHFFSIERDQSIYDGLEISKDTKLCEEYMGKYPVISISLKGINAAAYEDAFDLQFRLCKEQRKNSSFYQIVNTWANMINLYIENFWTVIWAKTVFCGGLKILSKLLEKHYRLKVILLIDEYDVPLAKAFENGYYEQMIFQDYGKCVSGKLLDQHQQ